MIMNGVAAVVTVIFGVGVTSLDPADSGRRLIEQKMLTQDAKFKKNSFKRRKCWIRRK